MTRLTVDVNIYAKPPEKGKRPAKDAIGVPMQFRGMRPTKAIGGVPQQMRPPVTGLGQVPTIMKNTKRGPASAVAAKTKQLRDSARPRTGPQMAASMRRRMRTAQHGDACACGCQDGLRAGVMRTVARGYDVRVTSRDVEEAYQAYHYKGPGGKEVRSGVHPTRERAASELFNVSPKVNTVSTSHSLNGRPSGRDIRSHQRSGTAFHATGLGYVGRK